MATFGSKLILSIVLMFTWVPLRIAFGLIMLVFSFVLFTFAAIMNVVLETLTWVWDL